MTSARPVPATKAPRSWWGTLWHGLGSSLSGLSATWVHLRRGFVQSFLRKGQRPATSPVHVLAPTPFTEPFGPVTVQYPAEQVPIPDVGRYRLYMETEDCIGCDQCARICPVDCITIEKIRAVDDLGLTSDGSKKRFYLPTFDIDMAKCCFCGLCTVVCPTECIVMTKVYDYSEYDRENFIYHFGNLSPDQARDKQAQLDAFELAKKAAKSAAASGGSVATPAASAPAAEPPVSPSELPPQPIAPVKLPKGLKPPVGIKPPTVTPAAPDQQDDKPRSTETSVNSDRPVGDTRPMLPEQPVPAPPSDDALKDDAPASAPRPAVNPPAGVKPPVGVKPPPGIKPPTSPTADAAAADAPTTPPPGVKPPAGMKPPAGLKPPPGVKPPAPPPTDPPADADPA